MKKLLIDTQLLVLLIVGLASPKYISQHKRLGAYTEDDFDLLLEIIGRFGEIVVTPNTLTEASNLLRQTREPLLGQIFGVFHALISRTRETYIESRVAAEHASFPRLGLTDAVLMIPESGEQVLITADLDLYLAAASANRAAENFNHLREARGLT